MSKVVSFRLDEENFEERQALAVLEEWQAKGYSTREILTWALMALGGTPSPQEKQETESAEAKATIDELRLVLSQAQDFLTALKDIQGMPEELQVANQPTPVLTAEFMASVRKAARPGLVLPDDES